MTVDQLIISQLRGNIACHEAERSEQLGEELERRRLAVQERLATISAAHLGALQNARLNASQSLRANRCLEEWQTANHLIAAWIARDTPLTFAGISQLNDVLVEPELRGVRQYEIYAGTAQFLGVEYLGAMIEEFASQVLANENIPFLAKLACTYQWLVSLHPFRDGNGRTSRLVVDWGLLARGFPPLTYPSPMMGYAALHANNPNRTLGEVMEKIFFGVMHSYEILDTPPGSG